jgi:hypothetical protein
MISSLLGAASVAAIAYMTFQDALVAVLAGFVLLLVIMIALTLRAPRNAALADPITSGAVTTAPLTSSPAPASRRAGDSRAQDAATAWFHYGGALLSRERDAEALDAFEYALCLAAGDAESLLRKGRMFMRMGRFMDAALAYTCALTLLPESAPDSAEAQAAQARATEAVERPTGERILVLSLPEAAYRALCAASAQAKQPLEIVASGVIVDYLRAQPPVCDRREEV